MPYSHRDAAVLEALARSVVSAANAVDGHRWSLRDVQLQARFGGAGVTWVARLGSRSLENAAPEDALRALASEILGGAQ